MNYFIFFFILTLFSFSTLASDWAIDPHLYSRGGITLKDDFSRKGVGENTFNLGAWSQESNAFAVPLTEVTVEFKKGDKFKYTYGIDVGNNLRFLNTDTTATTGSTPMPLNERLNFMEFFHSETTSFWFGQRAYRGDGDFLTRAFPFDEHNLFGGGIRKEKVGPVNLEFAYGMKERGDQSRLINILINKVEYPLANGKIKSNIEVHQVNDANTQNRSTAYIAGVQFQRWGDKIGDGNLYNLLLVNYSHGNIYSGAMRSAFNLDDKDSLASKWVLQWAGDYKTPKYAVYYTFNFQDHLGYETDQVWSYLDLHLRPVYVLCKNMTAGLDYEKRIVTKEDFGTASMDWAKDQEGSRIALMWAYAMEDHQYDLPTISVFVGTISKEKETQFYKGQANSKTENFVRLNYEIAF
ncbi:MAG: hypothetical protein A2504_01570 [Bdellovibrionales bacterium RIFOXYD12_FULL_39_22]|nr:MAG: hypothetical protein A2385_04095 [Bdellovibrionales bacterium RIFOXYB1_FULL_39_21]OFZ42405.1 MAG: hypothetical protein A2485_15400 [Bdellovibrionales bacterium RIFOXYC12_FULL_39_17]OFZ46294.1 MAG: hypothetical protein A2404_13615 [Bdellovibrionales bacterium RIFOXYC1_FULL_39_130]OFZ72270.1 MAG: hypothetical protein A2451_04970 [Bdellovibrionales bacterium RIFOXYC2_FULL_39_8]OFZ75187.1 MAG: hypothetical protein A2560_15670 [Bdellovibrionales bacterium RIFOXYD1_FULL_39_84]OFZ93181.1 MAG: